MVLKEFYRTKDNKGIELDKWISDDENKKKIYDMRCLYIIKSNAENSTHSPTRIRSAREDDVSGDPKVVIVDVFKFGVAGLDGGTGAFGRLMSYVHSYGESNTLNPCMGVRLFYLGGNKYNPDVSTQNSEVWKRELFLKKEMKERGLTSRGLERTKAALEDLLCLVRAPIKEMTHRLYDEATKRKESKRKALKEATERFESEQSLTEDDKIIQIIKHKPVRPKKGDTTEYLVKWSRPFTSTKGKNQDQTWETYEAVEEYEGVVDELGGDLGGVDLIESYKDDYQRKNKNAKWND